MLYAVTGGTGFLGEHLIDQLLNEGHQVRVLARTARSLPSRPGQELINCSISDEQTLVKNFTGVDGIYHLAGVVEHSRRPEVAASCRQVNVEGTLTVVRAAKSAAVKRIVYASTSGTVACFEEGMVAKDSSPYAMEVTKEWPYYSSKIEAEQKALAMARELGVELVSMRPSLLLGPGDRRLSSCRTVYDLLHQKVPLVPGGGLSFVDVRDAAAMFQAAMSKGRPFGTYLLGSVNLTVREYFHMVEEVSGVKAPFLVVPTVAAWAMAYSIYGVKGLFGNWDPSYDPVMVEMGQVFWWLEATSAKQDLGFQPREPKQTVRETVEWLRANEKSLAL